MKQASPSDVDDSTSDDIEYLYIKAVLSGKVFPEAAKRLLQLLGLAVLRGDEIALHHRHWLGYALIAAGKGADPAIALRVKMRRARPVEITWVDAIFFIHPRIMEGKPPAAACAEAAVELGHELGRDIDEKTLRTLYKRHFEPVYRALGEERCRKMELSEFAEFVRATEQVIVPGYPFVEHRREYVDVRRKRGD